MLVMIPGLACSAQDTEGEQEEVEALPPAADMAMPPVEAPLPEEIPPPEVIRDDRKVSERIADASLAARVKMALLEAEGLRLLDFKPEVVRGRVTLVTDSLTPDQQRRAVEVARQVAGVQDVATSAALLAPIPVARIEMPEESSARAEPSEAVVPKAQIEEKAASAAASETYHTVRNGESLWLISKKYGVSVNQIQKLNGMKSGKIRPGQRLRVK